MASQRCLFPPPPSPYPPAQVTYGNSGGLGYNYRGMQEEFHHGPSGESHTFSGAAGHISFKQVEDAAFQNAGGNIPQDPRSSYPLPRYLPVQQPQYLQQYFCAHPAPLIPAATAHPLPGIAVGVDYRDITQRHAQLNSMQPHAMSYNFDMTNCTGSYFPQQPEYSLPMAARPESQNRPLLMGPPIRMGFGSGNDTAVDLPAQVQLQIKSQSLHDGVPQLRHHAEPPPQPFCRTSQHVSRSANDSPGAHPKQRNGERKRPHDRLAEAEQFESQRKLEHATKALVGPCFDIPIPVIPPTSREKEKRSKKKRRRHNQLGLTPKTVKQESGEEDNEADKEAKLTVAACLPAAERMEICYKGEVFELKSASDITAWIEERRKRFPTKARRESQDEHQRNLGGKLLASGRALAESETAKQRGRGLINDGEDAKGEGELLLKLKDLKRRLIKQGRRIRAAEAKVMRLKSEANKDGAGVFEAATHESKRFEKSAGEKGMTVLGNTDIIKLEGADPLVTQLPTPPLQEDRSISDGETAQGYVKPESEDGREVVSSIPTHSPLIPASQPSRPASSDKTAELSLEQEAPRLQTEPPRSPRSSTIHTAELPVIPNNPAS